jgi:tetratricopeptide (TPR) repeat protein
MLNGYICVRKLRKGVIANMYKKFISTICVILFICSVYEMKVYALPDNPSTNSTSYTTTISITNDSVEPSQDAYKPAGTFYDLNLNNAQDLYIKDMIMYVADTGNGRVLIVNLDTNEVEIIGEGILSSPRGVSADLNGRIYVADTANGEAYRFDKEGNLEFTFTKPQEPSYGNDEPFTPVKITASRDGGVLIVSEGTKGGIINISGEGSFLGYFASNDIKYGFREYVMDLFLTEAQMNFFLKRVPATFANIFRTEDALVYSANLGQIAGVAKHNINGIDMFRGDFFARVNSVKDIFITDNGLIYSIGEEGRINETTSEGWFISSFGGINEQNERVGLLQSPSGLGVDSNGHIYVLDGNRNFIQIFKVSNIHKKILNAIERYNDGLYLETVEILNEVLKYNNTSAISHYYRAESYMRLLEYEKAREGFRTINGKFSYSLAYWEIRNIWLQNNIAYILYSVLLILLLSKVIKFLDRKFNILKYIRTFKEVLVKYKVVDDIFKLKYAMIHPIDNAYDITVGKTGNYLSSFLLYIYLFIIFVLVQIGQGYLFSVNIDNFSIIYALITFIVFFILFIIGNYLMTSLKDGLGTLKDIVFTCIYSFAPIIIFAPFLIIIANFTSYNEAFLIALSYWMLIVWSSINLFISFMEIHGYTIRENISSFILTFLFSAISVISISIGYLLLKNIFTFVIQIIKEVLLRV